MAGSFEKHRSHTINLDFPYYNFVYVLGSLNLLLSYYGALSILTKNVVLIHPFTK